jgi:hypothetical protein
MTIEETLKQLAADGHSRTSAHKALGWTWHTFRTTAADYPDIQWRKPGEHMLPKYRATGTSK